MRHFRNCRDAWTQTDIKSSPINTVRIKVLVVDPEFPGDIPDYQRKYETWLLEQAKGSGRSPKALRKIEDDDDVPLNHSKF